MKQLLQTIRDFGDRAINAEIDRIPKDVIAALNHSVEHPLRWYAQQGSSIWLKVCEYDEWVRKSRIKLRVEDWSSFLQLMVNDFILHSLDHGAVNEDYWEEITKVDCSSMEALEMYTNKERGKGLYEVIEQTCSKFKQHPDWVIDIDGATYRVYNPIWRQVMRVSQLLTEHVVNGRKGFEDIKSWVDMCTHATDPIQLQAYHIEHFSLSEHFFMLTDPIDELLRKH